MKRFVIGLTVLAVILIIGNVTWGSIVINGGFEDPTVPDFAFNVVASMPGWESTGTRGFEIHRHLNGWQPYEGNQYIENTHSVNTFQTLATDAGATYLLSYAYSARPTVASNPLEVYWDGNLISSHDESGVGNTNTTWTLFSFNVTAASNSTLLEFVSPAVDVGTYLDAVSVESVNTIPEPVSLAVWSLLGAFGYITVRRKRRR